MSYNNYKGNNAIECSIESIVDNFFFEIPPYQRLYEWEKEQIETLLEDVKKVCFNANGEPQNKIYFIGNVVVSEENGKYILIDGQQRLTTLFLIGIYLASEGYEEWSKFVKSDKKLRISMPLRENEEKWLSELIDKDGKTDKYFKELSKKNPNIQYKITQGLKVIAEWFENNKSNLGDFSNFLYGTNKDGNQNGVRFALVELAEKTDLNQFFVRMNNRGKQLEKHEILKARLLGAISTEEQQKYAKIWDLCSDMDKYIFALESDRKIFGREKDLHGNLFGMNDGKPIRKTLQDIYKKKLYEIAKEFKDPNNLCISDEENHNGTELFKIIEKCTPQEIKEQSKDATYHSIVDFSTFLLHIFKLFVMEKKLEINVSIEKDKLLKTMWDDDGREEFWKENSNVKEFIKQLLLYRFAFDYFVIKQKVGDSSYVIDWNYIKDNKSGRMLFEDNKLTNDDLKNLVMIQNYLRVARAGERQNYHHWLTYMLKKAYEILFNNNQDENIQNTIRNFLNDERGVVKELEDLDTDLSYAQMGDNKDDNLLAITKQYLEGKGSAEWNEGEGKEFNQWALENLNQGTGTPHYWFYRLEYCLWKEGVSVEVVDKDFTIDRKNFEDIRQKYRFRGLNSVEHIQPQSKAEGEWGGNQEDNNKKIDCFGNLALISQSFNSSLSNQDTGDKILDLRKKINKDDVESLKLWLVYAKIESQDDKKTWTYKMALKHQNEMLKVLEASFNRSEK